MLCEFDATLHKGDNPGAWTCVVVDDVAARFCTRGLVKIRGAIGEEAGDTIPEALPSRLSGSIRTAPRGAHGAF